MTNKIEIFIFRHGETDWNKENRFQGHTDIPLNEMGVKQAHQLASEVINLKPEVLLTSDLMRAKHTAHIVNGLMGIPLIETPMLRECRLGDPEGMLRTDIEKKYGKDSWQKWLSMKKEDENFSFPNGESKREHLERQIQYLESFFTDNSHYSRVAISTHGGSLRRLVHNCHNAPLELIPIPNCALYKIFFDTNKRIWIFSEALYLAPSKEIKTETIF